MLRLVGTGASGAPTDVEASRPGGAPAPALASVRRDRPLRRVLFVAGIDGAPLRYRALLPAEAIGLYGVESEVLHYRSRDVPAAAARADALVVYRSPASDAAGRADRVGPAREACRCCSTSTT